MRSANIISCIFGILGVCALAQQISSPAPAPGKRIVIVASTVLDGKGRALHDTRIVVENSKIAAIDAKAAPVDYDLRGLTVLPGWIDAHEIVIATRHSAARFSRESGIQSSAQRWIPALRRSGASRNDGDEKKPGS